MEIEAIDLAAVARLLERELGGRAPEGFVRGRTVLRDQVVARFGCSLLEAERMIDTMIGRGFLSFSGYPGSVEDRPGVWRVNV
jgi:hypothetical protein